MSSIKLSPNASGTGAFTIAAPNSNTDRTLTLPDATGTVQVSGNPISGTTGSFSGDLSFNSGYGSAAVAYGCRAWVNFDGTGTVAIRAAGNVSSITDLGVGFYGINFTTAMPTLLYAVVASTYFVNDASGVGIIFSVPESTTQARIVIARQDSTGGMDSAGLQVAIFR